MNMKKILILISIIVLSAVSCEKHTLPEEPQQLEVNAHNISGQWTLVEWNGMHMAEGTYVYLDIVRNDKTYTMYQNMDSFTNVPHVVTGSYTIYTDPELGAIIRGSYDHDNGEWAHRYIVKSLTANEMVWIAKDDATYVQTYVRADTIPVK